ncbi:hypothetical protein IAR55_000361 [Kwoniella newhampshirensis]|uniref:Phospholipid/glycerol acyltransferase domain-containing protein n=1 Tax=Kwoniella newhampshirensis TaxID=1651941 RepID=A0AAW0Z6E6_9TREE
MTQRPLYTIPIAERPPHGPLTSKIFFPLLFNLAQLGINSAQFLCLPLLLIPFVGRRAFDSATVILITVLFGPTSFVFTTDSPPSINNLVERDARGEMTKLNLPDRLVVMANHQAYLDWMYIWIMSCYAGHSAGLIILLKASLKRLPVVGWGMHAQSADEGDKSSESSSLLASKKRSPLWLVIFPEGTITSDDERVKSVKYAKREEILLDMTIGYPGVPYSKYPQDCEALLNEESAPPETGLATPEQSRAFELWLRSVWTEKEKRMEGFYQHQSFDEGPTQVVPVKQL